MDPKDPHRAANLLIQQFGSEATAHAADRCLTFKLAGDQAGVRAWIDITAAIMQLQATGPAKGRRCTDMCTSQPVVYDERPRASPDRSHV